jgi:hypothetical protein
MKTNALPHYDSSDNPTNCCPRFNPEGWDDCELHFKDKLFLKAETKSVLHVPIGIGRVFTSTFADIERAGAYGEDDFIVLSHDESPWKGEHYFAVSRDVPNHEMVRISGDFISKVFEGPYKDVPGWEKEMKSLARSRGRAPKKTYFFYTTCPKCAKLYGKNYVVGITEVEPAAVMA